MKKRIVLIAVIIMALIAVTMIYQTFATNSGTSKNNVFDITLASIEEITVPANSSKTYYYQITNTNKGVVQYAVVYSGDNITVRVFDDSDDSVNGTIDYGENKFVKLLVENDGKYDSTASIKTVLGYEKGGSLEESNVVPEDHEFVTEKFINRDCNDSNSLICKIINLYKNNNPTLITHKDESNNKIADYYYSSSVGLMNDGLNISGNFITDATALKSGTKGNIRYYGATPNNYIYFNCDDYNNQSDSTCEKWRIIGIVDGKVKIIRDEPLGNFSWDYTSTGEYDNNWHDSTLQVLLNNGYYNNSDGVSYYNNSTTPITINFKTDHKGIKNDKTRKMISDSTWYLGGHSTAEIYPNDIFGYERGIGRCSSCTYETTWTGKVGLMYPSDYGYASDLSVCNQTLKNYETTTNCKETDWLFNGAHYWLITPTSSDSNLSWLEGSTGYIYYGDGVQQPRGVRVVLYLDYSLTLKDDGDGSYNKPYQIDVN